MSTAPAAGMTPPTEAPASGSGLGAEAQLQLTWLASPALPVGGFSYSEGLEAAIEAGWLRREEEVRDWLLDQLTLGLARCDLPVLAQALPAWRRGDAARLAELNTWLRVTRESAELRLQTEQMGRSMLEWLRNTPGAAQAADLAILARLQPAPTWPLAFACAAARTGAPDTACLLSHAFGWAENQVQAAIKAVPLGQSAGQRILQALLQVMPAAVHAAQARADADRMAFTPRLAIASARHETQYSRLFRS